VVDDVAAILVRMVRGTILCLIAAASVAGCRAPVRSADVEQLLGQADRVGRALGRKIETAGREPSEEKRVRELTRLNRLSDALARARLVGYMSYVDRDTARFAQARADLRELERALGLPDGSAG
jgi:hypothetical protein